MTDRGRAYTVLTANTLAFTLCFAVWMLNGVLITFLVENQVYDFTRSEMGWLIGIPVLTGAVMRLPAGMLADRFGGRPVFATLMLLTAGGAFLDSFANSFWTFIGGGLLFGLAGSTFAVGIAYSSVWFPKRQQGLALGIFGAGNAGAAITAMGAPWLLGVLTNAGANLDGWRNLPRIYAGVLVVTTILFWMFTYPKKAEEKTERTIFQRLEPLKRIRVWRFGLYYFLVFGGFVALAQWLIPYYVNVYGSTVIVAGLLSAIFTLPSGVIRAFGGWLADRFGARSVMYWTLGGIALSCFMLIVPRMNMESPGEGVMSLRGGTVTAVSATAISVDAMKYELTPPPPDTAREGMIIWPRSTFGQKPVVEVGDTVVKKQLLAQGTTQVYFQANIWIFTGFVFVVGILMGIGKAAVYKHIPEYYPNDVGTVGGIVGVVGGLGGFACPIIFGYLLDGTGIWTTTWMFLFAVALTCIIWMHLVIRRMTIAHAPHIAHRFEAPDIDVTVPLTVACPVHGTHAQVQVLAHVGDARNVQLAECSLLGTEGITCEGRCVAGADQTIPITEPNREAKT